MSHLCNLGLDVDLARIAEVLAMKAIVVLSPLKVIFDIPNDLYISAILFNLLLISKNSKILII